MLKIIIMFLGIVIIVLAGIFFMTKCDSIGKFISPSGEEKKDISATAADETFVRDKEDNEVMVVEEVEIEMNVINSDRYEGTLIDIENNNIYFMVDKKVKEVPYASKDVEDYEVVFNIDTFNFKEGSYYDALEYLDPEEKDGYQRYYSASELEFLVGEYLSAYYYKAQDPETNNVYRGLSFQPWSRLKSSIMSITQ